jgi:hypothetical protein
MKSILLYYFKINKNISRCIYSYNNKLLKNFYDILRFMLFVWQSHLALARAKPTGFARTLRVLAKPVPEDGCCEVRIYLKNQN